MKVALITHEGGGISSVSQGLARSLARKKIHATIFTAKHGQDLETEVWNEYLDIVRFPIPNLPPRSVWFQTMNLNKLLDRFKEYTIVHGVSPDASFLFTFYKKKLRKPFVTSIHGSARVFQREFIHSPLSSWTLGDFGTHIIRFPLNDFSTRRCLINSDHAVVCSNTALEELGSYGKLNPERTSVIRNGVDFAEIDQVTARSKGNESDVSIIYAGRLVWTKGVTFLLRAFNSLRQELKHTNLKIFGSGPLELQIKRYVLQSRLGDCVHIQSRIRHEDLIREIKKSTIAVLPSLYEGQPMFALEAMACKKPLLVFDAPYARELIANMKNGVLSKMHDYKDLSEKMRLLLSDRQLCLRLGQNAYDYVKQRHNWENQATDYVEMYQKAIARSSQR